MQNNEKKPIKDAQGNTTSKDSFPPIESMNVSSATELTGMMYRAPQTKEEIDAYLDLYDIEYAANIFDTDDF